MSVTLEIDGEVQAVAIASDVLARLREISASEHADVWARNSDGRAMCLLKSNARAFVTYFREQEDSGLISIATDDRVGEDLRFRLANGLVDEYPASWTVPFDEAARALSSLWASQELPAELAWQET